MAESSTQRRTKTPKNTPEQPQIAPSEGVPRQISFFQRIQEIPLADWGTRAKVRVYRLEPLVDQVRSTGKKYITIYDDGPPDEERIKVDHGSGRYRLYLNVKTAGQSAEREIDMIEIDILDLKFPPRLDLGDWLDDPKNRKWNWAKKMLEDQASKNAPPVAPANSGAPGFLETVQAVNELRKSTVEELRAMQPAAPAAHEKDPLDQAAKIIQLTQGGGQAVLMEMFRDEMKATRLEMAAEREANRKLQEELRKKADVPAPAPVDPIEALAKGIESVKKIQDTLAPSRGDSIITPGMKSRMSGWQEFFVNIAEKIFESPATATAVNAITQAVFARSMQSNAPMRPNGAPALNPATPQAPPDQMRLVTDMLQAITVPMLNMFGDEENGGDFAEWLYEGHGENWVHPSGTPVPWYTGMKQIGAANIVTYFKQSPLWTGLQDKETAFTKFIAEFVAWEVDEDDAAPASDDGAPEIVEFEGNNL
jgi:hypothetical protein